jgi:hypothetical protein
MGVKQFTPSANWITGLLDPDFIGRTDVPELAGGLRKCENFVPLQSGAMRTRPTLDYTAIAWNDWLSEGTFVRMYNIATTDGDDVVLVLTEENNIIPLFKNLRVRIVNTTTGTINGLGTIGYFEALLGLETTVSVEQFGDSVFIAGNGFAPHRIILSSNTLEPIEFFEELPGLFSTGASVDIDYTQLPSGSLVPGTVDATVPLAVGDIVKFANGTTGEVFVIEATQTTNSDSACVGSGTIYFRLLTGPIPAPSGNFTVIGTATTYTYLPTNIRPNLFITQESIATVGTEIRVFTDEYTVVSSDEHSVEIGTALSADLLNVRVASKLPPADAVYATRAVTTYQGRLLFGGSWSANFSPIGLFYSAVYDPFVIRPKIQLEGDAASPIAIELLVADDDAILWLSGGDTLFVGGTNKEYAQVNQGPIGATAELLPRFIVTGSSGSNNDTPFTVFEGRAMFAPKLGGAINMFQYSEEKAKYSGQNIAWGVGSYLQSPVDIALRAPTRGDPVYRTLVRNDDGSLMTAMFTTLDDRPSWAELTYQLPTETSDSFIVRDIIAVNDKFLAVIQRSDTDFVTIVKWSFDSTSPLAEFTGDLAVQCTGSGSTWNVGPAYSQGLYEGTHLAIGLLDGQYTSVGTVTIAPDGSFTTPVDVTEVYVMKKYECRAALLSIAIADELGGSMHRKSRVIEVHTRIRNTRQLRCNREPLLPDTRATIEKELPKHTGVRQTFANSGWTTDPVVEWEAAVPYNAIIDSAIIKMVV